MASLTNSLKHPNDANEFRHQLCHFYKQADMPTIVMSILDKVMGDAKTSALDGRFFSCTVVGRPVGRDIAEVIHRLKGHGLRARYDKYEGVIFVSGWDQP